MNDELVKRLRDCADSYNQCSECKYRFGSPDRSKLCLDLLMEDAADAIEELSEPRWISVTERLPEEKRASYLCLTDGGYCHEVRWTNSIYGLVESDNWGWSIFDIPQFSRVTHWMPLPKAPEPPKEET